MQNAAAPDQSSTDPILPRASAIGRGLTRTGQIGDLRAAMSRGVDADERWLTLPARSGEFYFIRADGAELWRGDSFGDAVELSAGFRAAMEKIGALSDTGMAAEKS